MIAEYDTPTEDSYIRLVLNTPTESLYRILVL